MASNTLTKNGNCLAASTHPSFCLSSVGTMLLFLWNRKVHLNSTLLTFSSERETHGEAVNFRQKVRSSVYMHILIPDNVAKNMNRR